MVNTNLLIRCQASTAIIDKIKQKVLDVSDERDKLQQQMTQSTGLNDQLALRVDQYRDLI